MASFGVQKSNIFGTYGEFSVGAEGDRVRAQFLLSKIRPGIEGSWENELASQMGPWREVFNVEELTFDELLQRDLDDSRVAHSLIPYLLGDSGQFARFFPPILAVVVPRTTGRSGIGSYYPAPTIVDQNKTSYGDLFDFTRMVFDGQLSPLGQIAYNRQRAALVIVDGQHRAMAVLALHRQLNDGWGANTYASYYNHLQVTPDEVRHIELPVCIVFFPDLTEDATELKTRGITLKTVCREIFLVVNRSAKQVSESRELLLDDDDFAARMMRQTLSKLKDRGEDVDSVGRIYSFAFGDATADTSKQVMAGQLEYSSALILHKMHAAASFALPAAFNFTKVSDITDGRNVRNPARPVQILFGTSLDKWPTLSRRSCKAHAPEDVLQATEKLGAVTDEIVISLFDRFRPYASHNSEMRALRTRLQDPVAKSNLIQSKCYSLLFEGSGVKNVFDDHAKRLLERRDELVEEGRTVGDYITSQIEYCNSVKAALMTHEGAVRLSRACRFFSIDETSFMARAGAEKDGELRELLQRARSIFDTVATQAFQLGFLMAVLSVVELTFLPDRKYDDRLRLVRFVTGLYIECLNAYFSPASTTRHRTLAGYVTEPRARVFEPSQLGLRGLLAMSVPEINERQWEFFRYVVLELVHSRAASNVMSSTLAGASTTEDAHEYRTTLPAILEQTVQLRGRYVEMAVDKALRVPEFQRKLDLLAATAKEKGKTDAEVKQMADEERTFETKRVRELCRQHLSASLGKAEDVKAMLKRFGVELDPSALILEQEVKVPLDVDDGDEQTGV